MHQITFWEEIEPIVVQNGHFIFSSGCHSDQHSNFVSGLLPGRIRKRLVDELCKICASMELGSWTDLVVVGYGCGRWYAEMVAERLGVPSLYADKSAYGGLTFNRGQAAFIHKKNALIIDDVISTGLTAVHLAELVEIHEAKVMGALFILDRNKQPTGLFITASGKSFAPTVLFHQPMQTWHRSECPLCEQGVPFSTDVGHGENEFQIHGWPQGKS
jgi:orotate phosphoribosyltransferase